MVPERVMEELEMARAVPAKVAEGLLTVMGEPVMVREAPGRAEAELGMVLTELEKVKREPM